MNESAPTSTNGNEAPKTPESKERKKYSAIVVDYDLNTSDLLKYAELSGVYTDCRVLRRRYLDKQFTPLADVLNVRGTATMHERVHFGAHLTEDEKRDKEVLEFDLTSPKQEFEVTDEVLTDDAMVEMLARDQDPERPWRWAALEEQLTLARAFSNEVTESPIFAPGSFTQKINGDCIFPVLRKDKEGRILGEELVAWTGFAHRFHTKFNPNQRFMRVRLTRVR